MSADQIKKIETLCKKISKQTNKYGFSESFVKKQHEKLKEIQKYTCPLRPARLLIIGRRGSGKSSLINAMLGKYMCKISDVKPGTKTPEWHKYKGKDRELELLDTRGFKDTLDTGGDSEREILDKIKENVPDVVLFLCKAKEVNASIDGDLDSVEKILKEIKSPLNQCIPLIGVVTQCDELNPRDVKLPTNNKKKTENIEQATSDLQKHLSSLNRANTALKYSFNRASDQVVETSAYAEYEEENGEIKNDSRWNIDKLMEATYKLVPAAAKYEHPSKIMANLEKIKDELAHLEEANKVVHDTNITTSVVAATVSYLSFIPGVPLVTVLGIQLNMVIAIAKIGGHKITLKDAGNFLLSHKGLPTIADDVKGDVIESIVSIIAQWVGEQGVIQGIEKTLLKALPIIAPIFNAVVSADATKKLGEAAICYYILNEDTPPETLPSLVPVPAY